MSSTPTLVINAPRWRAVRDGARSFQATFDSGVGRGYALTRAIHQGCASGCRVVLLSKDERRRAEGVLLELVRTEKTDNGLWRYDVHVRGFKEVTYQPE